MSEDVLATVASGTILRVTAPLTQVLAGTELVAAPACGNCRRPIWAGSGVTVYAYRRAGEARWQVPRVYCPRCDRGGIESPTTGWAEALVTAELVAVEGASRIEPVAVLDWAGTDEGIALE